MAFFLDQRWGRLSGVRLELLVSLYSGIIIIPLMIYTGRARFSGIPQKLGGAGCSYLCWLAISSIWSIDPFETIFQAGIYTYFFVFILLFQPRYPEYTLELVLKALITLAALSWLYYLVAGHAALSPKEVAWRLRGILDHEQRLAIYMGFALILLLVQKLQGDPVKYFWLTLGLLAITLFATFARAYMAFVFVLLVLMLQTYVRPVRFALWTLGPIIAGGMLVILPDVLQFFSRGDADVTLTGRTTIWAYALDAWQERPLLGYGYGSFPTMVQNIGVFESYVPPHAHNSQIHTLFEAGVIGTFLLMMWIIRLIRLSAGGAPMPHRYILVFSLLAGLTGIVFGEKINGALILVLLVFSLQFHRATISQNKTCR